MSEPQPSLSDTQPPERGHADQKGAPMTALSPTVLRERATRIESWAGTERGQAAAWRADRLREAAADLRLLADLLDAIEEAEMLHTLALHLGARGDVIGADYLTRLAAVLEAHRD